MSQRVFITGIGLISSLGDSAAQLHAALCSERSGIAGNQSFDIKGLTCQFAASVESFQAEKYLGPINLRPLDRSSRLASAAARLAIDDSGWTPDTLAQENVGLVLGTMFGSLKTISEFDQRILEAGPTYVSPLDFANTVINAAAGQTAIVHKLRGVNSTISTGPTSGLQAIAYASDLIRSGGAKALLAGGVEELCFQSFYNFDRAGLLCACNKSHRAIPFHPQRNGFVLGEGAALLMLEDEASISQRGAPVLAEIHGHASGFAPQTDDNDQAIETIARTMQLALSDARVDADNIDCISASANGSIDWDRREAHAIAKVFDGHSGEVPVSAIKSLLGETLGAAGALQVASAIQAMRDGVLPGISGLNQREHDLPLTHATNCNQRIDAHITLVNSIGFDGQCCSLVIARHERTN